MRLACRSSPPVSSSTCWVALGCCDSPTSIIGFKPAPSVLRWGVCLILVGTAVMAEGDPTRLKAVLCIAFIAITSPTAAHALARAARISGIELWDQSVVDQFERERTP